MYHGSKVAAAAAVDTSDKFEYLFCIFKAATLNAPNDTHDPVSVNEMQ